MKKATTAAPIASLLVTPMAEILKLSAKDQCARFAERATTQQRAFSEMGKLHHAISAGLRKNQTIYGELRKVGVKDSTISNASYASRVWGELVVPGHLTEADFDGFTFSDCLAICRAAGDRSKRRLSGEEVAVIVHEKPGTFDAELESIYATGLTVEEAEAQAAAQAATQAKAEKDAKAEAERKAAEKVEQEKQAAIAAALQQQRAEHEQQQPAPTPSPAASSSLAASEADEDVAPPPAASTPPAPANESPSTTLPTPANVVEMPADPDAELPEILTAIDDLVVAASGMSTEAKKAVFAKLNEAMGFLAESIDEPAAA